MQGIRQVPRKRAPFYSQAPGLGKRAAIGLLRGGRGTSAGQVGRRLELLPGRLA
jgi:hypothetical protein